MSISYEDALSTLQSMFGEPWTRETLDTVLRHQQGHMENTVDLILRHGNRHPQILVDQLQSGEDPQAQAIDADEQLARQLAASQNRRRAPGAAAGTSSTTAAAQKKGRGTPTTLPDDFLRIPNAGSTSSQMDSDEALARMLQDELFTQELSRNPQFAHLARGGGGRSSTAAARSRASAGRAASQRQSQQQQQPEVDIMKSLGELGQNARRRLQMMAAQFSARTNRNSATAAGGGGDEMAAAGAGVAASERRGLLDDDGEEGALEFASRKDL